ncbi:MAG TPA: dTDP-4-dehydrorhamnose reductase [Burkholderiales bacterium]
MPRILVIGRNGQVGWELLTALEPLGTVIGLDRNGMDLASPDSIRRAIRGAKPDVIVNAAAYNNVDRAESESALAMQVNGIAPGVMAEEAKRLGAILVHYSTDYVFDGERDRPYIEDDPPNPVNAYGKSKLAGERAVAAAGGSHLILRTSWVYSARGSNFVLTVLRLAREKPELSVVDDQSGSPTWARALASATAELLRRKELITRASVVYHLTAGGHTSRYAFARAIIDIMKEVSGIPDGWASVKPITSDQYPLPARRPPHPVASTDKIKRVFGIEMPRWEDQLRSCLRDHAASWRTGSTSQALP